MSAAIGFSRKLQAGTHVFAEGKNIAAQEVLFIGVGPLADFGYQEIQSFGRRAMELTTSERPQATALALGVASY
jgi:lactam utilization protein B